MKTAVVTGATSFVGVELCDRLSTQGVTVCALVRPTSDLSRLDVLATPPTFIVLEPDTEVLVDQMKSCAPDVVFHLAGTFVTDDDDADPAALIRDNVAFGTEILAAAVAAGVRAIISTGSYFQFGLDGHKAPYNLYAASKDAFGAILNYYRNTYALRAATLVLFDTYGSRDWRKKLVPVIAAAQRTGAVLPLAAEDPLIDLVHGQDVADCFIEAAEHLLQGVDVDGQTFAVRSGQPVRLSELVELFAVVGGHKIVTRPGEWPAPSRPLPPLWEGPRVPGWSPKITLEDGLRDVIEAAR